MFEDFPKTRLEFEQRFSTQEGCLSYIFRLRWPQGFVCPHCAHTGKAWSTNRELFVCPACRRQTSVTAGTIFHRTRKPLTLWFRAIWYITCHKHGGNALGLQRELGLSYHTAWEWLHKLRLAMVRPDRDLLSGLVEVDESFIGGSKPGKAGRGAEGKVLIAVAVEDRGDEGFGRIRLHRIPDASSDSLLGFIQTHIAPESQIRTDGWRGYSKVGQSGFEHLVVVAKKQKEAGEDALPLCHRVISLFKRIWVSTFQGAIRPEHLDRYLEEFTFRFNRRKAKYRTLLAFRLLEYAVVCQPCPAKHIEQGLGRQSRRKPRLTDGLQVVSRPRRPEPALPLPVAAQAPLRDLPPLPF